MYPGRHLPVYGRLCSTVEFNFVSKNWLVLPETHTLWRFGEDSSCFSFEYCFINKKVCGPGTFPWSTIIYSRTLKSIQCWPSFPRVAMLDWGSVRRTAQYYAFCGTMLLANFFLPHHPTRNWKECILRENDEELLFSRDSKMEAPLEEATTEAPKEAMFHKWECYPKY